MSILGRSSEMVLHIVSCLCSTGEESYSLVMAMLHAGVQAESFIVDTVGGSRRAFESAEAGVFRPRSFHNDYELVLRDLLGLR